MAGKGDIINKLDHELLRSMLVELEAYRSGHSHFPALVGALDAGIHALIECEPEFVEALQREWRVLEEINALALDEGKLNPLRDDTAAAEAAIRTFEGAITARVSAVPQNGS